MIHNFLISKSLFYVSKRLIIYKSYKALSFEKKKHIV